MGSGGQTGLGQSSSFACAAEKRMSQDGVLIGMAQTILPKLSLVPPHHDFLYVTSFPAHHYILQLLLHPGKHYRLEAIKSLRCVNQANTRVSTQLLLPLTDSHHTETGTMSTVYWVAVLLTESY